MSNMSVPMCLDTSAPVPMSYEQFGTDACVLGLNCLYTACEGIQRWRVSNSEK